MELPNKYYMQVCGGRMQPIATENKLKIWKLALIEAEKEEAYEECAYIRDMIKELEKPIP